MLSNLTTITLAFIFSAITPAVFAEDIKTETFHWSAETGLGYDSNVHQAPSAPYIDYAVLPLGTNPTVNPKEKSGFFAPFQMTADFSKQNKNNGKLIGSVAFDGNLYLGNGLSNASEFNLGFKGGSETVLDQEGKSKDTVYIGALLEKHKQVYVDHDSGENKLSSLSSSDISVRYSYFSVGVEAKYKQKVGKIDYGLSGQYLVNDYEDPIVVTQLDHVYYKLGADISIPVNPRTKLAFSLDHAVRDYSNRHARNTQGVLLNTNPLLIYTYNSVGASLRNRISPNWLAYFDIRHTQRSDNFADYNNYNKNRYGVRVIYNQERFRARLALHHWVRDYPNGFAFDVATQGEKNFSGNQIKLKAEFDQADNSSLWTELRYKSQNSTDLRYDYERKQIMAGMSWKY